jgi:DNA-directed RNA polymerase sigma subunit (sigma70/sigma32)
MRADYKIKEMQELFDKGYTLAEIGRLFGVSRQRIHQLLKGDLGEKRAKKILESKGYEVKKKA